jgi:3-phenylpropionate/cinnamic acid dioxygenase small subunit
VAVQETVRREIESFLYLEARLSDESRYEEWEALLTDDMHYWVPQGAANHDPAERLAYINDNRARVATRIRQLRTGKRWSQTPISPMRRLLSNIEVLKADDPPGEYTVGANFVLYELAAQVTGALHTWAGRVTYKLRRVDGKFRLGGKTGVLVSASVPQPTVSFFL